jgi:hypothetical protein
MIHTKIFLQQCLTGVVHNNRKYIFHNLIKKKLLQAYEGMFILIAESENLGYTYNESGSELCTFYLYPISFWE